MPDCYLKTVCPSASVLCLEPLLLGFHLSSEVRMSHPVSSCVPSWPTIAQDSTDDRSSVLTSLPLYPFKETITASADMIIRRITSLLT